MNPWNLSDSVFHHYFTLLISAWLILNFSFEILLQTLLIYKTFCYLINIISVLFFSLYTFRTIHFLPQWAFTLSFEDVCFQDHILSFLQNASNLFTKNKIKDFNLYFGLFPFRLCTLSYTFRYFFLKKNNSKLTYNQ